MDGHDIAEKLTKAFGGKFENLGPAVIIAVPENWGPYQIAQFTEYWNAATGRTDVKFVPSGFEDVSAREKIEDLSDRLTEAEKWIAAVRRGDIKL